MLVLLFARLPASLREVAFKRIQRFVTSTCLPSVTQEASGMCQAATQAAPEQAIRQLAQPLLERLHQDLAGNTQPSKASAQALWPMPALLECVRLPMPMPAM